MLKPWNMNWTSCLVRTHPEGEQGLDHMRLKHRFEVINEGFFYPQAFYSRQTRRFQAYEL